MQGSVQTKTYIQIVRLRINKEIEAMGKYQKPSKNDKTKPLKTAKEKRQAKQEKKDNKGGINFGDK